MPAKKNPDIKKELKEAIKTEKLIIGSKKVFGGIKKGSLKTAIYASNSPETLKRDLNNYSPLSKADIKEAKINSSELGELCGKPFNILMVGIKK